MIIEIALGILLGAALLITWRLWFILAAAAIVLAVIGIIGYGLHQVGLLLPFLALLMATFVIGLFTGWVKMAFLEQTR